MYLRSIRLKNWKAYQDVWLELPEATSARNVVIVEGANGAGKTSLLEAFILCLYGRDGLHLVARASQRDRLAISYDGFLERALSTSAGPSSRRMAVELVLQDDQRTISFERIWYYNLSGRHLGEEEEVRIDDSDNNGFLAVPPGPEREPFVRSFLADNLLPVNLAPFFIFDGEQVAAFAQKDLAAQVRSGVEMVHGVPELKALAADLRSYARDRRKGVPDAQALTIDALRRRIAELESEERRAVAAIDLDSTAIVPLRQHRDSVVRQIGALHADTYDNFKALFERRERLSRDRSAQQEEIRIALSLNLPFALGGANLRNDIKAQLLAEGALEQREIAKTISKEKFAPFLEALRGAGFAEFIAARQDGLRTAWDAVWDDDPSQEERRALHGYLGDADRHLVERFLHQITEEAGSNIAPLVQEVARTDRQIENLEESIAQQKGVDEQSQHLANELQKLQADIASIEARLQGQVKHLDDVRGDLTTARGELQGLVSSSASNDAVLKASLDAEAYADVIETFIELTLPAKVSEFAGDLTDSYLRMAHKGVVDRIEIDQAGQVSLLSSNGQSLPTQDQSAGENHVFALALMAAIAKRNPMFPVIMDSPFGRLDGQHRMNVLRHFASLDMQYIILAHPDELSAENLRQIEGSLAGIVKVKSSVVAGIAKTLVEK